MSSLPLPLYNAAQCRELDRRAIAAGTPGYVLMQKAGEAAFQYLREHWPAATRIVVLVGRGNNGGDGYVLARLAWDQHLDVRLLTVGEHELLKGEVIAAASDATRARVPESSWAGTLPEADIYVDALFGTGLNRPPTGDFPAAIAALNASGKPVLALDIPSGLVADTGHAPGAVVQATATITFIALKTGLLTGRGPTLTGTLELTDLGLPASLAEGLAPVATRLSAMSLPGWLPRRARDAHKGDHGHVLVIGGNYGMAGAVALAGEAALRCGAGLVSVATRPEHLMMLNARRPELMCHGIRQASDLAPLLARADMVVLGPGLGHDDWGSALYGAVLDSAKPLVLDADGLNLLATMPDDLYPTPALRILTPHPGEAARLLGIDTASVQADRPAAAQALRERYESSIVLKGAGSLVADDEGLALCAYGNPGMAGGGMGDALAGIIGALLAQGLDAASATRAGVTVHALAADDAARSRGERGLLASDLFPFLQRRVNP
ncbi:MAG: NAD(P)H-hydrate dehydratase [Moraxellaceae bacterium]|nr:NAD(P)H-hydrate dehydratase [Moraxellaceae bacterium]